MKVFCLLGLLAMAPFAGLAQESAPWDESGNGQLRGVYNFRHVVWMAADGWGRLARAVSFTGTITFDGEGAYHLNARVWDSASSNVQSHSADGSYRIAASGLGYLRSPILENGSVYGTVSQGIFVGSSTDSQLNDLFIAAPAGAEQLSGRYRVAELNFPSGYLGDARSVQYDLNFDDQGSVGVVEASGFIGPYPDIFRQTLTGASYTFSEGAGSVSFGGDLRGANLVAGKRTLFASPDGSFIFGGDENGWNFFAGTRALTEEAAPDLRNGLHHQAGVYAPLGGLGLGSTTFYTFFGSLDAKDGAQVTHQRTLSALEDYPSDFSFSDSYAISAEGEYSDYQGFHHFIGADGISVGYGQYGSPGLIVTLRAPQLAQEGVFLQPAGVRNAASGTPYTVGISPGALLRLDGSGFPETAEGVSVTINGLSAPVREVSPTRIEVVAPFATAGPFASVQVHTPEGDSNLVTTFVSATTPGLFTVSGDGLGLVRAWRSDGSAVDADHPAAPGEWISLLASGLGAVSPEIPDGSPAPDNPSSGMVSGLGVFVDGLNAPVNFAGLAAGLVGIYIIEVQVPGGVREGMRYIDIATADAYNSQVWIALAADARTRAARASEQSRRRSQPLRNQAVPSGRP